MSDTTNATKRLVVRDGMDWAEFFVHESGPHGNGTDVRYSGSFCCISSFGVYGNHWSHMGNAFTDFVGEIDRHYLLGKIARKVHSDEKLVASLTRMIRQSRRDQRITKRVARDALDELTELQACHSGTDLSAMAYNGVALSHAKLEWSDVESTDWDVQASMFVDKMWPKFVAALQAASAVPA